MATLIGVVVALFYFYGILICYPFWWCLFKFYQPALTAFHREINAAKQLKLDEGIEVFHVIEQYPYVFAGGVLITTIVYAWIILKIRRAWIDWRAKRE